jgi:nitrate reductase gamma subunit
MVATGIERMEHINMSGWSLFLWSVFPYICLLILVVGTIYRYHCNQLSWTSKSSELLEKRLLSVGSTLFHWGLVFVIAGHVAGLLFPIEWYSSIGISPELYHMGAEVLGGFFGLLAFAGISVLLYRRITNRRVRQNSDLSDFVTDGLLWIVILLGLLVTIGYSTIYGAYEYRATVGPWIRSVIVLQPDAGLMAQVPVLLQVHIITAFILFAVSPFTRLVHLYSLPLTYLMRAPLQYRARDRFIRVPVQPQPMIPPKRPVFPEEPVLPKTERVPEPVAAAERELAATRRSR